MPDDRAKPGGAPPWAHKARWLVRRFRITCKGQDRTMPPIAWVRGGPPSLIKIIVSAALSGVLVVGCATSATTPASPPSATAEVRSAVPSPRPIPTRGTAPTPTTPPKLASDHDAWQTLLAAQETGQAAYNAAVLASMEAANNLDASGMIAAMTAAVSASSDMLAAVDSADIRPCFAEYAEMARRVAIESREGSTLLLEYWLAGPSGLQATFDDGLAKVTSAGKLDRDVVLPLLHAVSCKS